MSQYLSGDFVHEDGLSFIANPRFIQLEGEIACRGNIVITVNKTIWIVDHCIGPDPYVRTRRYAYNAHVRGHQSFLRHDNAHPHPGHADEHHRHDYDWKTGANFPGSPSWVGSAGWPTLGGFIDLVCTWYWENRDTLPEPDAGARAER